MLNITSENSIDAMKKLNIINKNVRIDNKIRKEVARNTVKSSDASNQIFENDVTNNNSSNSKTQNIHARIKVSIRCSNRLIKIKNSLNSVERNINTTAFATIDEILIEKEWNAMKVDKFKTYINDCNSENFLIVLLILQNESFAINILSR